MIPGRRGILTTRVSPLSAGASGHHGNGRACICIRTDAELRPGRSRLPEPSMLLPRRRHFLSTIKYFTAEKCSGKLSSPAEPLPPIPKRVALAQLSAKQSCRRGCRRRRHR